MQKGHNIFHYLFTILYLFAEHGPRLIIWIAMAYAGYYVLSTQMTPVNLVLGVPLTFAGGGLAVNSFWSIFQSIFYPRFNQGHCLLCDQKEFMNHSKVRKILGIKI